MAADFDGGDDVGFVEGDDEADGDVAVVGGVGGVEGAGGVVEADFAADFLAEGVLEFGGGGEGFVVAGVGAGQKDEGRGGGCCGCRCGHYSPVLRWNDPSSPWKATL